MWPQNFSKGMCTKIYGEVADKDKDKNKEASPSSQLQDKGGKDTGALHAPYPLLDFYHSIQTKRAQARKRLEISRVYQRTLSLFTSIETNVEVCLQSDFCFSFLSN